MGVVRTLRKNAASTISLIPPHQHCVTKPANAAARYCSSSVKRALKTAWYGRSVAAIALTSRLHRVQRVEPRNDLLDGRLLEVHILHLELRGHLCDQPVCGRHPRVERELHRPPLTLTNAHAGDAHVLHIVREVNPQPALRERASSKGVEAAVGKDHSLPDDDHALGERL